ncbi:MAG: NHLP bacteriocin export ABC transporter permease/ATPase subunit, partial [Symploca sp. SIO3E6]|nr:NHLP bacteriocin export ABC transporter permease/ATPase subunit [Caldora sp. SIO3E6]
LEFRPCFRSPFPDGKVRAIALVKFALRGRLGDILVLVSAGVLATLAGMVTPQATGFLVDVAIPSSDRRLLVEMGLGLFFASMGVTLLNLVQSFATLRIQTLASALTQAAIWDRLLSLPAGFFRQYSSGDLQNRANAIEQMRQKLSGTILSSLFSGFFSLLNLGLCLLYSPPLAVVAIGVAVVSVVVTTVAGIITRQKLRPLQELAGEIFGLTVQLIGGVSQLRIAGAEERAFAFWAFKYARRMKLLLSTQLIEDWQALFNTVLPTVSSGLLYWVAVTVVGADSISTGTFLAFNAAFGTFLGGATGLSNTVLDLLEITVYWERAQPILETEPEVSLNKLDPGLLRGHIKIDRVSFAYNEDSPKVLQDVTIEAKPGEFIAIVGPSGSGKSTLVRLLLGFEQPTQGRVLYDGKDFASLDGSAVRRQLGVVLQNAKIHSGTIYNQIVGNALVSRKEVWEAARMAGIAADIEEMPMGMNTVVSEGGTNLSGGQRQRLSIARALVLRPSIVIFDEATSNLDNRTQKIVMESLAELGVTRIVVAHRLTTIQDADQVYRI